MDSLTEKIVQLLVSHRVRLELWRSVCLRGIGGKILKFNHFSFILHSQLLCFHLVLQFDSVFQSENMTKAGWCTLNSSIHMLVHCFRITDIDRLLISG